jgi:hypothetical protein
MLLVEQNGVEIAVDDGVRVRRLYTDGRKAKTDNGAAEVKTEWKGDVLVSEVKADRGPKRTSRYALSADGRELRVVSRIEAPMTGAFDVTLVYVREPEAPGSAPAAPPSPAPPPAP